MIVFVAMVCLYSTGHWIGGTVLLLFYAGQVWGKVADPTGFNRWMERLRSMADD